MMAAKLFLTDLATGEFSEKAHCILRLRVSSHSGHYQLIMVISITHAY